MWTDLKLTIISGLAVLVVSPFVAAVAATVAAWSAARATSVAASAGSGTEFPASA